MARERDTEVEGVLAALRQHASAKFRADMGPRYGIVTADEVLGVPMSAMQKIAKAHAPDHALAAALWATRIYEARMVACMVDDPGQVTARQMDLWRRDFDNWAVTDTVCFKLFDRVAHAPAKVVAWARLNDEFGRRAAFALLASMAVHKRGDDALFVRGLGLIEDAATDERNFVKKGVNWALRAIGGRKTPPLRKAARDCAHRLAQSPDKTARWIGKDALRAFAKADAVPASAAARRS
jgi:3-methyladenine DNA glycosylase AlkD